MEDQKCSDSTLSHQFYEPSLPLRGSHNYAVVVLHELSRLAAFEERIHVYAAAISFVPGCRLGDMPG